MIMLQKVTIDNIVNEPRWRRQATRVEKRLPALALRRSRRPAAMAARCSSAKGWRAQPLERGLGSTKQRARARLEPPVRWGGEPSSGSSLPSSRGDDGHLLLCGEDEDSPLGLSSGLGLLFFLEKTFFFRKWYFSKIVLENCHFSKQF